MLACNKHLVLYINPGDPMLKASNCRLRNGETENENFQGFNYSFYHLPLQIDQYQSHVDDNHRRIKINNNEAI